MISYASNVLNAPKVRFSGVLLNLPEQIDRVLLAALLIRPAYLGHQFLVGPLLLHPFEMSKRLDKGLVDLGQ